jgi:hypothetical protein
MGWVRSILSLMFIGAMSLTMFIWARSYPHNWRPTQVRSETLASLGYRCSDDSLWRYAWPAHEFPGTIDLPNGRRAHTLQSAVGETCLMEDKGPYSMSFVEMAHLAGIDATLYKWWIGE